MITVDTIIDKILENEGGYSNNPNDAGGETNFGITVAVARANGYQGAMRDMSEATARRIYQQIYITAPGFDKVLELSPAIALELVDTGVNMGPGVAGKFLQRALNVLNQRKKLFANLAVDGGVGPGTLGALKLYLTYYSNKGGEAVLLTALNALQGARYIELAENQEADEDFVFGWLKNRVVLNAGN